MAEPPKRGEIAQEPRVAVSSLIGAKAVLPPPQLGIAGAQRATNGDVRREKELEEPAVVDEVMDDIMTVDAKPAAIDLGRYDSFAAELVRFSPPDDLPPEHAALVNDIVVLDHRSLQALGPRSPARAEVKALLLNAVTSAGYLLAGVASPSAKPRAKPAAPAVALYRHAEDIFARHIQTRNRLQYLLGVLGGIVLLVLVAYGVRLLPASVTRAIPAELLPALIFFAGLGSIVSVLLRLSELDVVREISRLILVISGLGRPFVASAFALVIYLVIASKLVAVSFGDAKDVSAGTYLVIAFLCGFSERFAQDILDRAELGLRKSQPERK